MSWVVGRGSWVVGPGSWIEVVDRGRGSWVWVNVVGKKKRESLSVHTRRHIPLPRGEKQISGFFSTNGHQKASRRKKKKKRQKERNCEKKRKKETSR